MIFRLLKIFLIPILIFSTSILFAQHDTISLNAEIFNSQDIEKHESNANTKENYTSILSRFSEKSENATQPIYIITKEEIRRMGYSSLLDVLRMLPGMQVASAGSAIMGEHFSLRGNLGNRYMKILLNGIPIRPNATLGMPLGNQLPIKQAERIEVMYEPSVIYGEDACSGVINIITKESDRPAYTNADIKFGSQRYNEINVFFGGKFGKDKNIVSFDAYGNYTFCSDRNIYTGNDSVFALKNYALPGANLFTDISRHPNLQIQGVLDGELAKGKLPYESHSFGFHAKFKGLRINFDNMYRQDHSALGYNTRTMSYANSSDYIAENITRFAIGWERHKQRVDRKISINTNIYKMDPHSANTYLQPYTLHELIKNDLQQFPPKDTAARIEQLNRNFVDSFFFGKRYQNTYSLETTFDTYAKRDFKHGFTLFTGLNIKYADGIKYMGYNGFANENLNNFIFNNTDVASSLRRRDKNQLANEFIYYGINQTAKLIFNNKKIYASVGYLFMANLESYRNGADLALPKEMSIAYTFNSKLKICSNFHSNYMKSNLYFFDNSVLFNTKRDSATEEKVASVQYGTYLESESVKNYSLYSTYKLPKNQEIRLNLYYQKHENIVIPTISSFSNTLHNGVYVDPEIKSFYSNENFYYTTRYGIETSYRRNGDKGSFFEANLAISNYKTNLPNFKNDYPLIMLKTSRRTTKAFDKIDLNLDFILQTEPQNIYAKNDLNLKYYFRFLLNYYINSNLKAYFSSSFTNIRAGIAAPFVQQDLLDYNAQNRKAQLFFGLNYTLE